MLQQIGILCDRSETNILTCLSKKDEINKTIAIIVFSCNVCVSENGFDPGA